jgi:predicted transcriptional regulator
MYSTPSVENGNGRAIRRRSLLNLAPLELDCMNTLWPLGEGTVREIRDQLAPRRPRAYTTIMTIMDRLARKGVVERRKVGRAYRYKANLSVEDARADALGQLIEGFFGGSSAALLAQLGQAPALDARARNSVSQNAPAAPAATHIAEVATQRTPQRAEIVETRIDDTLL